MTTVAAPVVPPRHLPTRLHDDWRRLTAPTEPAEPFDPGMVDHLPEPARRWLRHAIAPGTPLRRRVVLRQHGTIRLGGSWRPFTAVQALDPLNGFLWPVTAHLFGLPVHGFDRYSDGTGEMRHRLLGVPVMTAAGPDIDRSAAARHTSEIIWAPAAALAPEVGWRPVDEDRVTVLIPCGRWTFAPTLTVAPAGALRQLSIPRWTDAGGAGWREEPFTGELHADGTFGGYTIPTRFTAGWGHGTPRWDDGGAFVREHIDDATYL
jgi:hypothetical protein